MAAHTLMVGQGAPLAQPDKPQLGRAVQGDLGSEPACHLSADTALRGVQGFGVSPVQATGETLPPGFEIRLESARFGAIRLVVAR